MYGLNNNILDIILNQTQKPGNSVVLVILHVAGERQNKPQFRTQQRFQMSR